MYIVYEMLQHRSQENLIIFKERSGKIQKICIREISNHPYLNTVTNLDNTLCAMLLNWPWHVTIFHIILGFEAY